MRALIAALVFTLSLSQAALAQRLLTPSEFRDAAIAALQAADPRAQVQASGELEVEVDRLGRTGGRANLEHAYAQYRENPSAQREILDGWVRFIARSTSAARTADRLVALLDARSTVERFADESARVRVRSGLEPSPLLWRPFAGDLAEVLAFAGEGGDVQLVMAEGLSELGLTQEQAWEAASRNLRSHLGSPTVVGVRGSDRLIYLGGAFAPSALINGTLCSGDAGRLAYLVVDVSGYVAGNRDDPAAMSQLRSLVDTLRRSGRSLSLTPLGCDQSRVVEVTLPD